MDVVTERAEDAERFQTLYLHTYSAVIRYVSRRVGSDDAPDILSEVYLVAWRRQADIPSPALPWLYGVARRVLANHRRGRDRAERLAERVARNVSVLDSPADRSGRLAAAFARLSPEDRDILGLVAWEGLGERDLATALSCSVSAATMRLHRARRRLQSHLQEEDS
jgi:RNA polymerase sigma-70 factor (ECF subfamily)